MDLQSRYRLERDRINTVTKDDYYFAYKISDSKTEIHITEIYIREEKRGNSAIYYNEMLQFIKGMEGIKFIFGFIWPNVFGSERSMMSMLKYGFKFHSVDGQKIILLLEVNNG